MANFDKYKCLRNIRELLKDSDLRLGSIEKEAGCQAGYMSRLEKEDNNTDPSMEFVVTAAKMLNVPMDILLKGDLGDLTDAEEYLMDFLKQLIEDTESCYLDWKLETEYYLTDELKPDPETNKLKHPFLFRYEGGEENFYASKFSNLETIDFRGNSYHCYLPKSDVYVYLLSIEDTDEYNRESFYDLYLVRDYDDSYKVTPICSSRDIRQGLATKVELLYAWIEKRASNVHIDYEVVQILDKYMYSRNFDKSKDK